MKKNMKEFRSLVICWKCKTESVVIAEFKCLNNRLWMDDAMGGFIYAHNPELLRNRATTWEHVDTHDNTEDVNDLNRHKVFD